MFEPYKTPNRRLTPKEQEDEKFLCQIFRRPPRHYLHDKPFYPYVPVDPNNRKYAVNFDLNPNF